MTLPPPVVPSRTGTKRRALRELSLPQSPFSRVSRQLLTRFANRFQVLARTRIASQRIGAAAHLSSDDLREST